MRVSRTAVLNAALFASLQASPQLIPAARAVFVQADDKSFDVTLPSSWQAVSPTRGAPPHIFSLSSRRGDDTAKLQITVDLAQADDWGKKFAPKKLADLGAVEDVGDRLRAQLPQPARLIRVDKMGAGSSGLFALASYVFRYALADGQAIVALSLTQGRVYKLTLNLPTEPDAALQAEAEAVLASFRAYPLNAGCLAASSNGQKAIPGVCY